MNHYYVDEILPQLSDLVGQTVTVRGKLYHRPGGSFICEMDAMRQFRGGRADQIRHEHCLLKVTNLGNDYPRVNRKNYIGTWSASYEEITGTICCVNGTYSIDVIPELRKCSSSEWSSWRYAKLQETEAINTLLNGSDRSWEISSAERTVETLDKGEPIFERVEQIIIAAPPEQRIRRGSKIR